MIRLCIVWIITCMSLVFSASLPNTRHEYDHSLRDKRSASGDNCESWSPWVNKHTPTTVDKNDTESMSPSDLEAFCPYSIGGNISRMRCMDDKGEPFFGVQNDLLHRYRIQCLDITVGVICTATKGTWDRQCPDLSVSYYCTCGKPPLITSTATSTVSSTAVTSRPSRKTTTAVTTPTTILPAVTTPVVKSSPAETTPTTILPAVTTLVVKSSPAVTTPTTILPAVTTPVVKSSPAVTTLMDKMPIEIPNGDDGTLHIDPKIFFYSSVATASCLLMLITMSCIITCLLCKRNGEDEGKRTKVRPF